MNKPYIRPIVTVYRRHEIEELMGPLKTQYVVACDTCAVVQVAPAAILQFKEEPLTIEVDTGGCTAFQQVEVSIPGSSPFVFYTFSRSEGSLSGGLWSHVITDFQFQGERGSYSVEVVLIDGEGRRTAPCMGTITIE